MGHILHFGKITSHKWVARELQSERFQVDSDVNAIFRPLCMRVSIFSFAYVRIPSVGLGLHVCFDRASSKGVTGKFFWWGKVIFPDFFPGVKCFFLVEDFHVGRPKTNFSGFEKWEAKKKKKKKKREVLSSFCNFFNFHFQFSYFSFQFSPLFPCLFFPSRSVIRKHF